MKKTVKKIWRKVEVFPISAYGFLKKDFVLLFRKKKYLYLSILLPLLIGLIYVFALKGNPAGMTVMLCDEDNTQLTQSAAQSFEGFTVTRDISENCTLKLRDAIRDRKYLFGLVIEEGFTQNVENLQQSYIVVYYDNSDPSVATLAEWKIDVALEPFKAELVRGFAEEIKTESAVARDQTQLAIELIPVSGSYVSKRAEQSIREADASLARLENIDPNFLSEPILTAQSGVYQTYDIMEVGIAPLFAVLSLFLLLMLCSTGLIYDRKSGLMSRIRASNSTMFTYVLSKLAFFFSVSIVQFLVVALLFVGFGARYDISIILLFKALLFMTLVNTAIGLIIGLISDSEGIAVLISLIITLPLLFLSGMFYPLEMMPKIIQWMAKLMPLNTEVWMMKQAMLFGGAIDNRYFLIPVVLVIVCMYFLRKTR